MVPTLWAEGGWGAWLGGGGAESLNRLPQFPQKRIPGGLAKPQLGHSFGMMSLFGQWHGSNHWKSGENDG